MDRHFSYRKDPTSGGQSWGNIIIYHSYLRCTTENCSWAATFPSLHNRPTRPTYPQVYGSLQMIAFYIHLSELKMTLPYSRTIYLNWLMKFNPGKCYTMTLATRTPMPKIYTFCGQTLTSVDSHFYIGIHLSNTLTWTAQTKAASTKAQQTLGVIRRNLNIGPTHIKAVAYTLLVRPILQYASAA